MAFTPPSGSGSRPQPAIPSSESDSPLRSAQPSGSGSPPQPEEMASSSRSPTSEANLNAPVTSPVTGSSSFHNIGAHINSLNIGLKKMKIVPAWALITDFLSTKRKARKLGLLIAIFQLYTDDPPIEAILKLGKHCKSLDAFFSSIIQWKDSKKVDFLNQLELASQSIQYEKDVDSVTMKLEENPQAFGCNSETVRQVIGLIVMVATFFGIPGMLEMKFFKDRATALKDLSQLIRSWREVDKATEEATSDLTVGLYKLFGQEYIPPSQQHFVKLAKDISDLHEEVCDFQRRQRLDFFGVQIDPIKDFEARYHKFNDRYIRYMSNAKSNYNFAQKLSEIHVKVGEMRGCITDLYKSVAGKQKPVCIWFCGPSNTGKTYISDQLATDLAKNMNTTVYSRTSSDKFHSGYRGQGIFKIDDILQFVDSDDLTEFHKYASGDQKDVMGAGIDDKGFPFTSKVIVMSSNKTWITPPTKITDYLSANRRRDYVIYVSNPDVEKYRSEHSSEPPSSWFAQHPSKYYLINPTFGYDFSSTNYEQNLKFSPNAVWVLGEVSYHEILESVKNKELQNREDFRRRLVSLDKALYYEVPKEPIKNDPTRLLETKFSKSVKSVKASQFKAKYPGDLIRNASDEELTSSEEELQAIKGATYIRYETYYATILVGPPGCGKTTFCRYYKPKLWDYQEQNLEGDILVDDFAYSQENLDAFMNLLNRYYIGETNITRLFATANKDTAYFPKKNTDTFQALRRKAVYCELTFKNTFTIFKSANTITDLVSKMSWEDRLKIINVKFEHHEQGSFPQDLLGLRSCVDMTMIKPNDIIEFHDFCLPRPLDPEIVFDIPLRIEDITVLNITCAKVYINRGKGLEPMTAWEKATNAAHFSPLFSKFSSVLADVDNFVKILNEKRIVCADMPHTLVKSLDLEMGILSQDGVLVLYNIDPESPELEIFDTYAKCGVETIRYKDQVPAYTSILKINREQRHQIIENEVKIKTFESSDLNVSVHAIIPILSSAVNLLAIASLSGGLFSSLEEEGEEKIVEERRKRGQGKAYSGSTTSKTDNDPKDNNVYVDKRSEQSIDKYLNERRRRGKGNFAGAATSQAEIASKNQDVTIDKSNETEVNKYVFENSERMYLVTRGRGIGILMDGDVYYFRKSNSQNFLGTRSQIQGWTVTQFSMPKEIVNVTSICNTVVEGDADFPTNWVAAYFDPKKCNLKSDNKCWNIIPAPSHMELIRPEGSRDPGAREMVTKVGGNACYIYENNQFICHGLLVCKRYGITNAHAGTNITVKYNDIMYKTKVISANRAKDVMMFEILDSQFSFVKDITHLFINNATLSKYLATRENDLALLLAIYGNLPCLQQVCAKAHLIDDSVVNDDSTIRYRYDLAGLGYSGATKDGDCGSPIFLMCPQINEKLVGIHRAGNNSTSVAAIVTREMIQDMLNCEYKTESNLAFRSNKHVEYFEQRVCPNTGLNIIGKIEKPIYTPSATKECRTPIEYELTHEPSIKHSRDPRNVNKLRMDYKALSNYNCKVKTDPQEWNDAFDEIGNYIVCKMLNKNQKNRVLSKTESINGTSIHEYSHTKPIDRKGSAGYPWVEKYKNSTQKQNYMEQRDDKWYLDGKMGQEMSSAIDLLIEDAKRGTQHHLPFIAYLKDETLKIKKTRGDDIKTRMFFSGPCHYLIAFRQYFGTACWLLNSMYTQTPIKVGINSASLEWNDFAMEHLKVSHLGYASDMKNWDGGVPMEALQGSLRVWNYIYKMTDPNWKEEDDLVRATLHKNIEGAEIILGNLVYKLNGCMVSGFPATALSNSLINWALHYIVWRRLALIHDPDNANFFAFMDLTCLSVYGDDNIITIDPSVHSWFHFNSFVAMAATLGFTVTDSKKTGEEQPNLSEFLTLDFLKMGFRLSSNVVYPTVDDDSVNKQLLWHKGTGSYEYDGEWRTLQSFDSFLLALDNLWPVIALSGEEVYNKWKIKVLRSNVYNINIFVPTYRDALRRTDYF